MMNDVLGEIMCHVACCNMMNDVLANVIRHVACCNMINDVLGRLCVMLHVVI